MRTVQALIQMCLSFLVVFILQPAQAQAEISATNFEEGFSEFINQQTKGTTTQDNWAYGKCYFQFSNLVQDGSDLKVNIYHYFKGLDGAPYGTEVFKIKKLIVNNFIGRIGVSSYFGNLFEAVSVSDDGYEALFFYDPSQQLAKLRITDPKINYLGYWECEAEL